MKVLVMNGSPKKESTTMMLTEAFLKGYQANMDSNIKVIESYHADVKYCTGCLSCWTKNDDKCVLEDDMRSIMDDIKSSDVIIWSFPLYYHGIPASLKSIIDRLIPFLNIKMYAKEDGSIDHERFFDIASKKNVVITGCGYPYYPDNFAALRKHLDMIFGKPVTLCVCETSLLGIPVPDLAPAKEKLLADMEKAGYDFASKGSISPDTISTIEKPMIPNEMYINMVNSL